MLGIMRPVRLVLQGLTYRGSFRFGVVDEYVHLGLDTASPLLSLLLRVESAIDGLVAASANFCATVLAALTDVCHSRLHATGGIRLVWILPFRQFSGKGQFLTPAHAGL